MYIFFTSLNYFFFINILIIQNKNTHIIAKYNHNSILYNKPSVYLAIIAGIFSGKYLPITLLISFSPMLYFIKVIALKNISVIANANTAPSNVLLTKKIAKKINITIINASKLNTYTFKCFLAALKLPNIPTNIPINTNTIDTWYTNGSGLVNLMNGENNWPLKFWYKAT